MSDHYPLGRDPEWEQRRYSAPLQPAPRYIPHRADSLDPGWDPTTATAADLTIPAPPPVIVQEPKW